jgi:hypothetical protein
MCVVTSNYLVRSNDWLLAALPGKFIKRNTFEQSYQLAKQFLFTKRHLTARDYPLKEAVLVRVASPTRGSSSCSR